MKKRLVVLLIVAIALAAAPAALADHCVTCKSGRCAIAFTGGYLSCTQLANGCSLSGSCGGPHPFTEEEFLATEFVVASVERLVRGRPRASAHRRSPLIHTSPASSTNRAGILLMQRINDQCVNVAPVRSRLATAASHP